MAEVETAEMSERDREELTAALRGALALEVANRIRDGHMYTAQGWGVWLDTDGDMLSAWDGDMEYARDAVRVMSVREVWSYGRDLSPAADVLHEPERVVRAWVDEHGAEALAKAREELAKG